MRKRPNLRLVGKGEGDDGAASIFDDMDGLRAAFVAPSIMPTATTAAKSGPLRRARGKETFAPIPHDRAIELYRRRISGSAWAVLVELDRMILAQRGKNPVLFWSPKLRAAGLRASYRTKVLRELEAAGVVEVTWRGRGLSPLVRHLWYPPRD
jgi:hypothetical protein